VAVKRHNTARQRRLDPKKPNLARIGKGQKLCLGVTPQGRGLDKDSPRQDLPNCVLFRSNQARLKPVSSQESPVRGDVGKGKVIDLAQVIFAFPGRLAIAPVGLDPLLANDSNL